MSEIPDGAPVILTRGNYSARIVGEDGSRYVVPFQRATVDHYQPDFASYAVKLDNNADDRLVWIDDEDLRMVLSARRLTEADKFSSPGRLRLINPDGHPLIYPGLIEARLCWPDHFIDIETEV